MMIANDSKISSDNHMKSEDIKKLIVEAKSVQGSANALVIGEMLERLIRAVEDLMTKAASQDSELAKHRTTVFGAKSERFGNADQFAGESQTPPPASDDEVEVSTISSSPADVSQTVEQIKELKAEARRLALEAGLHTAKKKVKLGPHTSTAVKPAEETVRHPLPDDLLVKCPLCKDKVQDRGKSYESQEIDIVSSNYIVRTNIMHKASCLCGSLQFCMPSPVKGVLGSRFSPRFVATVLYDKFVMHLPVYRQVKAMKDHGLKVSRSIINNIILRSYETLKPVIDRIIILNQAEPNQQCDESPITTVIDGERKKQFLWGVVTRLAITYTITATRSKEVARQVIGGAIKGVLTTDCLAIYTGLFPTKEESGCIAHLRRKFWYTLINFPLESITILRLIGDLYKIERRTAAVTADERLKVRRAESIPIMEKIYATLGGYDPPPQSALGKAIAYAKNHQDKLWYFTKDGATPIDNNLAENALRPSKLGFKNFLFTQSILGCDAVAGVYTLIATCVLHNVSPLEYMTDVITKLNSGWPQGKLDDLLPWNWQPDSPQTPAQPIQIRTIRHDAGKIIELAGVRQKINRLKQRVQ